MSVKRTLTEHLAYMGETMQRVQHSTIWSDCAIDNGGHLFVFISAYEPTAEKAAELLGAAGLLCEGCTGVFSGEEAQTPTNLVVAVVDGLRALHGTWRVL